MTNNIGKCDAKIYLIKEFQIYIVSNEMIAMKERKK
jgi:hypothetical protein